MQSSLPIKNQLSLWNVLVVDNEPDSVRVVEMVCQFHGARVRSALSGFACLDRLQESIPDLIFLDIQMPGMTGWDVIKQIRANPAWADVVVIAMTAHALGGDRERILSAGFDAYFPKPISPLTLVKNVQSLMAEKADKIKPRTDTILAATPVPVPVKPV